MYNYFLHQKSAACTRNNGEFSVSDPHKIASAFAIDYDRAWISLTFSINKKNRMHDFTSSKLLYGRVRPYNNY
jgi:hypothetical protein